MPSAEETKLIDNMEADVARRAAKAKQLAAADKKTAENSAAALGDLIVKLNPYTSSHNKDTKRSTGQMNIYMEALEMEGPYSQEWTFKGQPQRVGMAARIKYKYPVRDDDGTTLFWVDDYVLIGFQGTMGG